MGFSWSFLSTAWNKFPSFFKEISGMKTRNYFYYPYLQRIIFQAFERLKSKQQISSGCYGNFLSIFGS
jgi:hypothetical protein